MPVRVFVQHVFMPWSGEWLVGVVLGSGRGTLGEWLVGYPWVGVSKPWGVVGNLGEWLVGVPLGRGK